MTRTVALLTRFERLVSYSALAVLLLSVLWGVMTRYVTERPAVWTTELSGILFTWVVFVGATTAFREDRHIRVTLLIDLLPLRAAAIVQFVGKVIVLCFLAYVTYLSYVMMTKGATRLSPVMRIPFSWVYLATFLAFAVMTATEAVRLFRPGPARPASEPESAL